MPGGMRMESESGRQVSRVSWNSVQSAFGKSVVGIFWQEEVDFYMDGKVGGPDVFPVEQSQMRGKI